VTEIQRVAPIQLSSPINAEDEIERIDAIRAAPHILALLAYPHESGFLTVGRTAGRNSLPEQRKPALEIVTA